MIAASEPQEFIPRGRQQALRHPGPLEPTFKPDKTFDEFIQSGLEKVSIGQEKSNEWWILRSAPENSILPNEKHVGANSSTNAKSGFNQTKTQSFHQTDYSEDSSSFKTCPETSELPRLGKRLSASPRFPNKRISSGSDLRLGFKSSFDTNKSQSGNPNLVNPSKIPTKLKHSYMEDELYIKDQTAIWSRGLLNNEDSTDNGRKVIACYTVPLQIKQALFCTFYCERPMFDLSLMEMQGSVNKNSGTPVQAICLVDAHHVRAFALKGEQYVIPVPFQIEQVWSTKFGILIERSAECNSEQNYHLESPASVYSLTYPLDDVCPVVINQNSATVRLNSTNLRIVHTSENPSICVMFDASTKEHSVYKIRKVKIEENEINIEQGNHSMSCNSNKLKSRLSMWDNVTSNHIITPSPIKASSKPGPSMEKLSFPIHYQKSRTGIMHSPMAALSRVQSPASFSNTQSPWTANVQVVKKATMGRSVLPEGDFSTKSFFSCSKTMSYLRSHPQICFEYLWTDTYSVQDTLSGTPASKVFLTEDVIGQWYLCYILPSRFQLSIVKVDLSGSNIGFGVLTSIGARDAVAIPHLRMMAILEHSGNVTLYSGLNPVGKLHLSGTLTQHTPSPYVRRQMFSTPFPRRSSLLPQAKQPADPQFDEYLLSPVLPTPSSHLGRAVANFPMPVQLALHDRIEKKAVLTNLIDAIENRVTLKYSDGTFYRITLPIIASSCLVESCLNTLRQCLSKDAAMVLMCRWYSIRNGIGTTNCNNEQEWEMFVGLLLELLGYEDDDILERPITPGEDVKRQKTNYSGTDEDWSYLITSERQNLADQLSKILGMEFAKPRNEPKFPTKVNINSQSVLFPYIRIVQYTLHLLYEDMKLNTYFTGCLKPLVKLLSKFSNDLGLKEYSIHYWKDFPREVKMGGPKIKENLFKSINHWQKLCEKPPNIFEHIFKLLEGQFIIPYPYFYNVNNRSRDIVQLCGVLSHTSKNIPSEILLQSFIKDLNEPQTAANTPTCQKSVTFSSEGKSVEQVILLMVSMKIDTRYIDTLPMGIYFLIYNALWKCRENPPSDWPVEAYHLLWREDLVAHAQKVDPKKDILTQEQIDICFQIQETMPNTKQEIAEIDGMEDIDSNLTRMRFSKDVRIIEARKMLASSKPVSILLTQRPEVSDHDFIEEQEKHLYGICIRTMALPVGRGMMTLRTTTPIITEPLPAPALCLKGKVPSGPTVELNHIDIPSNMNLWPLFHNGVANGLRITPDAQNIDSTWIIFNKPKGGSSQMEHAGFLMALGLNGHLKNLAVLSTFDYFGKEHEMTSVGVLLGLSAAFRGTCHQFLTKILAIHIEALLPPTSMELDVPQILQVSGLLGIGLLYQGSAHRHMTEVLLSEIGRPPGPEMENSVDRESYSLTAGLSLGLVMLKYGDQPAGMSDLNVPDTLHYYMIGGIRRPLTGTQRERYKTPSFQIREGSSVNLDVTAPGATLALGMMYMGTGNKAVADWMAPPETQYLLDFVRPDFLMLRILSRSLILWNEVEASKEWVESQVPGTIKPYCMVTPSNDVDIDYEAMNQAYCNIVAGACFALGLKYAGSADKEAFETLLFFCHMFTSLTGKSIAELAGKATIETCLNVLVLSASLVMAGTGNLEILRLVRHLRRRVGNANSAIVTYGSHLALHMALGFLFLGGGRYSLSNSPSSIAALICALYPKFPTHSNDNRYHLQAFRHLYVLAVEPRLVIPKDVTCDDICYAKLRIVKLDGSELSVKGPGLVPDVSSLSKVIVDDERYWPVVFERGRNWNLLVQILSTTGYIEVKQRAGCLSYLADKLGYHSELARTLTHSSVVPWDPSSCSIVNFTSDDTVRKFCDLILTLENKGLDKKCIPPEQSLFTQMLTRITYDAVVKDKLMIINVFAYLAKTILDLNSAPSQVGIWQLKIILKQVMIKNDSQNLFAKETILSLVQQMIQILDSWEDSLKDCIGLLLQSKEDFYSENLVTNERLAAYVTFYDIPCGLGLEKGDVLRNIMSLKRFDLSSETVSKILKFC